MAAPEVYFLCSQTKVVGVGVGMVVEVELKVEKCCYSKVEEVVGFC